VKLPSLIRSKWAFLFGIPVLAGFLALATLLLSPRPPLLENTPFSTAYYDRNGALLRLTLAADEKYRLFTPLNEISPDLITATLTQEDRHFYHHPGINPVSIGRAAFETYIKRSRPMGGSTITMQVVRLRDNLNTRSVAGKFLQAVRAVQLERHYTKNEIFEAYLNLAPYGGNIHGAGTASLIYFRQPAAKLAMPQSLGLAVIPQNPVKRSPLNKDTIAWHEARLRLFEYLPDSYEPYRQQTQMPLTAANRDDLPFLAPHFIDGLDKTASVRVQTTIDLPMQKLLERRLAAWIGRAQRKGMDNAALMLVHAPTMEVRALIGSGDFFDKKLQGQVDGTAARRSPGSTLKPFIYALALEQGIIHPETLLADDPISFAEYRPGNFDGRFIGLIPAREALALSRNVPAIGLAARLGEPGIYGFLQNGGANFPEGKEHYGLSIAAGGAEIDMRSLTRLYAMLANGGLLQDLKYIKDHPSGAIHSMLSPESALLTLTMLDRPNPDVLPFTLQNSNLPIYWKTGTSNGFRDAWTIGVFGPYVLAVWIGHFDGRPNHAFIGAEAAAPLFFELAEAISQKEKLQDMVHPAMEKLNLARVAICRQTGALKACANSGEGWFIPGRSPFATTGRKQNRPEILSPRNGLAYVTSRNSAEPLQIPLEAKNLSGNGAAYWFANNSLIGMVEDGKPLFWQPEPGNHTIRYLDSEGRSAVQKITVIATE